MSKKQALAVARSKFGSNAAVEQTESAKRDSQVFRVGVHKNIGLPVFFVLGESVINFEDAVMNAEHDVALALNRKRELYRVKFGTYPPMDKLIEKYPNGLN